MVLKLWDTSVRSLSTAYVKFAVNVVTLCILAFSGRTSALSWDGKGELLRNIVTPSHVSAGQLIQLFRMLLDGSNMWVKLIDAIIHCLRQI
jgi:hypothetical protein